MDQVANSSFIGRTQSFLFSPRGRISRKQLWQLFGVWLLIGFVVNAWVSLSVSRTNIVGLLNEDANNPLFISLRIQWLAEFAMLGLSIVPLVKRFHDRGMSGWWVVWAPLIAFAPFIVEKLIGADFIALGGQLAVWLLEAWYFGTLITFFVILSVLKGERGENRFGPDPLGGEYD